LALVSSTKEEFSMHLRPLLGLLGLFGLLAATVVGSTALAAQPHGYTCSGGAIPAGTYDGVTIAAGSTCAFAGGTVEINGDLVVEDGAILNDHAGPVASVHVTGNVRVGKGAVLGLGSYNPFAQQETVVDGNVIATQPGTLYLSFMTIRGNLISNGGGDASRNFPIKDITVGGNLSIQGWSGLWMGVIRDTVGGNVIVNNNTALDTSQLPGSDSTEVANNDIAGNLICQHNSPAAEIGDTEQPGSRVAGRKIGECAAF
jgi:hypothetical protein